MLIIFVFAKSFYNSHQLHREKVTAMSYQCFKETHDCVVILCPACWLNGLRLYLFLGKILSGWAIDTCWVLLSCTVFAVIYDVLQKKGSAILLALHLLNAQPNTAEGISVQCASCGSPSHNPNSFHISSAYILETIGHWCAPRLIYAAFATQCSEWQRTTNARSQVAYGTSNTHTHTPSVCCSRTWNSNTHLYSSFDFCSLWLLSHNAGEPLVLSFLGKCQNFKSVFK